MHTRRILLRAALLAMALATSAPAFADPPPWAPAHGYRAKKTYEVREHRYVYYPAQQVYYAPDTRTWFWINGGNWQFGMNLPHQVHVSVNSGIPVVLQSDRPYVEHVYVEERYGRPWREKHKKKKKKHERYEDDDWDHHDHGHGHGRHDD